MRTTLACLWLLSLAIGCSGNAPDPAPITAKNVEPNRQQIKSTQPKPDSPQAPTPDESGTPEQRVEAFRQQLAAVFHALPPPEVLEKPIACPAELAPKNSLRLPIIDGQLLRFFVAKRPRMQLEDGKVTPEPTIDPFLERSSPLFVRMLAHVRETFVASSSSMPHKPNNVAGALLLGIRDIVAGGRLLVLLGETSIVGNDPQRASGGRFSGHIAAQIMGTRRGLCFIEIEVEVDGETAAVVQPALEAALRREINRKLTAVVPGLHAYTSD